MSDLYDVDILAWSARQAELLRRVARGERVNDADLDWPNIIEEIESVRRSELRAVRGLLFQAFVHDLKAKAWPLARDAPQRCTGMHAASVARQQWNSCAAGRRDRRRMPRSHRQLLGDESGA